MELNLYKVQIKENIIFSIAIISLAHIIGSLLFIPAFLFLIPGGFIIGFIYEGELVGYLLAVIIMLHINILSGFMAFLNSKLCLKEVVRYNNKFLS